ncbi:MAG: CDC27 family protein [Muribaculaceae bacterium]|nr:CDC27 family protein [Muribaculaceae bacterium]
MRITWLLILASVSLLCGCRRTDAETLARLDRAEAMVMDDADSARAELREIDPAKLQGKDDRARYELLTAMARYRLNDYGHPDADSLISIAVDRFEDTSDRMRLMQALFLRADLRYQQEEYTDAMGDALRAYDIAEKGTNEDWKARTAEQIADIFAVTQNFKEAIPYIDKAIEHYRAAGKERNVRFSLCDKADALERINQARESIRLTDSIITLAKQEPEDRQLLAYCYISIFPSLYKQGQFERALQILEDYEKLSPLSSTECSYMAETLVRLDKVVESEPYLRRADSLASSRIEQSNKYRAMMFYHRASGNLLRANDYADSLRTIVVAEVHDILQQTPLAIQRDVYNKKYVNERERYYQTLNIAIIVAAILVIIIISTTLYLTYKVKLQRRDIENKMEEIHTLSLRLTDALGSEDLNNQLQESVESLFRNQWQTINTLCNRYFEDPESEISKTLIFSEFKKILSQMTNKKNMRQLDEAVNTYMDNILIRLREEYSKIKDEEIEFMTLILSGFSAKTICLFSGMTLNNFYTKRTRLIKRICQNVSPELAELIKYHT